MSTRIEWTNESWNPVSGCTKVSQGCKNCYAERLWPKVDGARIKREGGEPRVFTDVRTHSDRLDRPLHWRKPRRIFVNSMSDLFHEDVPDEFINRVFAVMEVARQHTFQILTKRPDRMCGWVSRRHAAIVQLGYPQGFAGRYPNAWLGVSVEDQDTTDGRIPLLFQTPAAIRFVSYEPALGPVNFRAICYDPSDRISSYDALCGEVLTDGMNEPRGGGVRLNWVIVGGESGLNARPAHPDWFRSVRDQCTVAGVPFFFKQWGEWAPVGPLYSDEDTEDHLAALDTDPDEWHRERWITRQGNKWSPRDGQAPDGTWAMRRVGKKAAGRLLDDREHSEYPA